jgi:hypothetical protein
MIARRVWLHSHFGAFLLVSCVSHAIHPALDVTRLLTVICADPALLVWHSSTTSRRRLLYM